MKKRIVAINASPRVNWNTDLLVQSAAAGAEAAGASVQYFQLYQLEKYTGCISCFGCKLPANEGRCVYRDGLTPVLEAIDEADALIIGTPNYLSDVSAAFRALYERLIFRAITYNAERPCCREAKIPTLLIMTSNVAEEKYEAYGYRQTLANYERTFNANVGPTELLICGDTLQVNDYSKFNWTYFNPEAKKQRRETVFPAEREKAFRMGAALLSR